MTEEIVKSALSKVMYPGFTKDIVTFGFVNGIEINGTDVKFNVEITSSAPEVAQQISDEAKKRIASSWRYKYYSKYQSSANAKREFFKG